MKLLHGTNDVTTKDEERYLLGKSKVEPNTDINIVEFKKHRRKVFRFRTRYEVNDEENLLVVLAKEKICEITLIIYQLRMEYRVSKFLYFFK